MPNATSVVRSAWKVIPQFQSLSIENSVEFYTEELGFELGVLHPDDGSCKPYFCSVFAGRKADTNIYLHECPAADFHTSSAMIALSTSELDEFYQLKARAKVRIAGETEDKPWGYRKFSLEDGDGNELMLFKALEGDNPGKS
jgi:catechol 2,3-dioxygenase-like lactoylglutathione lyase family enzyme